MGWRSGHGNGRGVPRIEVLPADEQRSAPVDRAEPLRDGRDPLGRVRTREAAAALARLPRRKGFLPSTYAADPRFATFDAGRLEWLAARRGEMCNAWGAVSVGVDALLVNASWEHAASQFLNWLAAQDGSAELFKSASTLAAAARQNTLAAWELGSREHASRPKRDSIAALRQRMAEAAAKQNGGK